MYTVTTIFFVVLYNYTGRSDVPVGAVIAVIVILTLAAVAVVCGILFLYR